MLNLNRAALALLQHGSTIVLAAASIAVGAWLAFPIPGTEIPQTGQTVAVLLVGALLGPVRGSMAVLIYLLVGLLGLPVYSDGGSGWQALTGPSAGYFAGFVLAAAVMGTLLKPPRHHDFLLASALFIVGHLLILLSGWAWLCLETGAGTAFSQGVAPFVYGGLAKSLLAAALLCANWYLLPTRFWRFRQQH